MSDTGTTSALQRNAFQDAEDGRGLLLVGALGEDWGVSGNDRTAWAALAIAPTDRDERTTNRATEMSGGTTNPWGVEASTRVNMLL
ncbi:hypothetical protein [Streptomyces sp. NPDC005548]|uniref:hypothetical protein n=1 Tax=Streptomyces sp. NPDC005548 TaxID=3364724 RepID=UPI00368CFF10